MIPFPSKFNRNDSSSSASASILYTTNVFSFLDFPHFHNFICTSPLSILHLMLFLYFSFSFSSPRQLWKVHSHSSTVTQGPSPSWQTKLVFFQLSWAPVHLGNHNSHVPAETSGKSHSFFFFFWERYWKDPFP